MKKIHPDSPCPCGSKKSYRTCCKPKRDRNKTILFIGILLGGIFVAKMATSTDSDIPEAPAGKVWSQEHGHFHDIPGESVIPPVSEPVISQDTLPMETAVDSANLVWSVEHGHYHDKRKVAAQEALGETVHAVQPRAGNIPQPDGPVPEGKVWSPEHGHWHTAPRQ